MLHLGDFLCIPPEPDLNASISSKPRAKQSSILGICHMFLVFHTFFFFFLEIPLPLFLWNSGNLSCTLFFPSGTCFFLIEVQLTHRVPLVTGVQHSESSMGTCVTGRCYDTTGSTPYAILFNPVTSWLLYFFIYLFWCIADTQCYISFECTT